MGASVIVTVVGVAVAASSKILAEEFKAWRPWLTNKLIALAVRRLHEQQRERYGQEWPSYVEEIPGDIGKTIAAAFLVWAGVRLGWIWRVEHRTAASASKRGRKINLKPALRFREEGMILGSVFLIALPLELLGLGIGIGISLALGAFPVLIQYLELIAGVSAAGFLAAVFFESGFFGRGQE